MNDVQPTIIPELTPTPTSELLGEAAQKAGDTWQTVLPYLKSIGLAILILAVGLILIGILKRTLKKVFRKSEKIDKSIATFVTSLVDILLKVLLFIVILTTLGIETTSIVAMLGAASLAIGIALQGALSNFAAGVMLMVFKPYKADDFISCNEYSGTVYDVNIFSTRLKTIDNKVVSIPNSMLISGPLTNYSSQEKRRVDIDVSVDYDSDIEKVKKVLMDIMKKHDKILDEPVPLARVIRLAESSINFTVRAWTKSEDYWDVMFDLNEGIKKEFDKNNITIPYPHMTIVQKEKKN